jgi:hypothetical protein
MLGHRRVETTKDVYLEPFKNLEVIALAALIRNRRHILPTLAAPFGSAPDDAGRDPDESVSRVPAAL